MNMEKHLLSSGGILGQPLQNSVKSNSSEQLINFFSNPFETEITKVTNEAHSTKSMVVGTNKHTLSYPISPYSKSKHPSPLSNFSNSHLTDRSSTNSSSCENFRSHNDLLAPTIPISRLGKASSDNPIFGFHDDSLVPPIPPRDYFISKQKFSKQSTIHPILKDGQKLSSTHYWLLPDKQNPPQQTDITDARKKSDYVNFKEFEKNTPNTNGNKKTAFHSNSRAQKDLLGRLVCGGREDDDVSLLGSMQGEGVGCDNDLDIQSTTDNNYSIESHEDSREMSMGELGGKMEVVMARVDGVTLEESQTVLSMCGWDVDAAEHYLKVENLFRLGLASRDRCKLVLHANAWDLSLAASHLVDITR